jgi:hypothetical protein
MAEQQPPTIVEGATTGDVDDEIPVAAKSAEDRKAAAALSSLDAPREDESAGTKDVDQEAVRKAMERLGGSASTNGAAAKKDTETKVVKKTVKVDPADVTLLVCLLGRLSVVSLVDLSKGFPAAATLAAQLPDSEALSTIVSCSRVLLCTKYSCFRTKSTNKQYQLILFLSQVEELELSKIKATDLLKAHDGDAGKALRAYIAPVA